MSEITLQSYGSVASPELVATKEGTVDEQDELNVRDTCGFSYQILLDTTFVDGFLDSTSQEKLYDR